MSKELQILCKYPLLMPAKTELEGYINVKGRDYKVHVRYLDENITLLSNDFGFSQSGNSDLVQYLDAFNDHLSKQNADVDDTNKSKHYRHVLTEYVELREFYINIKHCLLVPDLTSIIIATSDECGRTHHLTISINSNIDACFRVTEHDLPHKDELLIPNKSLNVIYERFLKTVEELQTFFGIMESLDTAWVLDPERPTTKDNYRRIGLDDNVSLVVTINPWMCNNIPQLQFLGPERLVDNYRLRISKNLPAWDVKGTPADELLKLLELEAFPSRQSGNNKAVLYDTGECCICFSSRLNGKLPEINCKNPSCEQFFHTDCLYQWLVSVGAKTRRCFNELHGECPNCENHISCLAL